MEMWNIIFWVAGIAACITFVLQQVYWTGMRMKKIPVSKWELWASRFRYFGVGLLLFGLALQFLAPPAGQRTAFISMLGGGLNALVAGFHLGVIRLMRAQNKRHSKS